MTSLGYLHNIGLDYVRTNNHFNESHSNDYIVDTTIEILNNFDYSDDSFQRKDIDSINLSEGMKYALQYNLFDNFTSINTLILNNDEISTQAKNQILSIENSFNTASLNNDIGFLETEINNHLSTFGSSSWNNNEEDFVGGFLYISQGSTEYWSETSANATTALSIIQVDAVGYLWGWYKAAFIDKYPNEECRIAAGLTMAVQASLFGGLSRLK